YAVSAVNCDSLEPSGLMSPSSTVRCITKDLQHSLDLASATSGEKVVTAQENEDDQSSSQSGAQTPGPQRPRSNSGRELTDEVRVTVCGLAFYQDDPSSSDDEGMPYTRQAKFKAAHSFKGPFDFDQIKVVQDLSGEHTDDRYFLSGSLDGKLRLWNIPDKKVALWNEVDGQTRLITAANFCQNGKYAVIGTYDGRCIFYDTEVSLRSV
ncbi:hypothetical protein GOODEAATRI_020007, partial [Goodea atripinnis]